MNCDIAWDSKMKTDGATVNGLSVSFDNGTRRYSCIGSGVSFNAWFAGTGADRKVEAEIFDSNEVCVDVLYVDAPHDTVPDPELVASVFSAQLAIRQA